MKESSKHATINGLKQLINAGVGVKPGENVLVMELLNSCFLFFQYILIGRDL